MSRKRKPEQHEFEKGTVYRLKDTQRHPLPCSNKGVLELAYLRKQRAFRGVHYIFMHPEGKWRMAFSTCQLIGIEIKKVA